MKTLSPLAFVFCLGCSQANGPAASPSVELAELWRLEGFEAPESVLVDEQSRFIYVSNVNGEGADLDGNGYISRLTLEGTLDTQAWATGLDAPKGMALIGDQLYVTDVVQIVCIDINSGEIINRWPVPGAGFLNDAAVGPDGRVYVSDSATSRIYVLDEDQMVRVWAEDERLASINGLLFEDDRLLVITMAGRFVSISLDGRSIEVIGEGLGNGDMLTPDGRGAYFASEWPGQVYHLQADGSFTVLSDTRDTPIYVNDGLYHDGVLILPHWQPGEVSAYRVQ